MTAEELKEAWHRGENVKYNGREYELLAVIYRRGPKGNKIVSGELKPLNGSNSVIIARVKEIERISADNG